MSKAKKVERLNREITALEERIRELTRQANAIGEFLVCSSRGRMEDNCCGRKVFVAAGQNPPADWLEFHDWDFGMEYMCPECARTHPDPDDVKDRYTRMGKTRNQKRRDAQRRKRQAARERTAAYWQEAVVFFAPGTFTAYLGTRLEMMGAYHAAGQAEEGLQAGSPPNLSDAHEPGTVFNPLRELPVEFGVSGEAYLASRGIVPK